jgi:hypothetical protein
MHNSKCHQCAYKSNVPGNTHIQCRYNWSKSEYNPPKANPHGVKNGWYTFPLEFDPIWQKEDCKAFNSEVDSNMFTSESDLLMSIVSIFKKSL